MKLRNFYYLFSLCFVFVIPALVQAYFVWSRVSLANLVVFVVIMTIMGGLWDIWATRHGKRDKVWLWTFNRKDTLGITFFDLPIEEYLFYVASSVSIVFLWEGLRFAQETGSAFMYVLVSSVGVWCLLFILISYIFLNKKDKI